MLVIFSLLQQGSQESPSLLVSLLPFIVIFGIFYLLLILPAKKKQKKHQEMIENIKPGEKIMTNGGIYGTITSIKDNKFEVKIASNVKIEISKSAVATVISDIRQEKKN